jgi:hypothetical protein
MQILFVLTCTRLFSNTHSFSNIRLLDVIFVLGQVSFHLLYLFFTFHTSKLGYSNHEDIEIVILLNVSSTKTAHYHTL